MSLLPVIHDLATAAVFAAGILLALPAVYLVCLALAALTGSGAKARPSTDSTVATIVPAHDEEGLVARTVTSLLAQAYPRDRLRVIVIADNCTDATASVARAAGAEVWERHNESALGKGHALRWAIDRLLAAPDPPDAVVVVDADSVADPGLVAALVAEHAAGAEAVQAEYLVLAEGDSARSRLVAAGFLLFHRVRLGGRRRLGLPAALVGNGMLFSRALLETHPWDAYTGVEDLEYTIRLRLAGIRPRFAPDARLLGPIPGTYTAMSSQRVRWEGGRIHAMKSWLPRLVSHTARVDGGAWDAAVDLLVPPIGLLAQLVGAGGLLALVAWKLGAIPPWAALPAVAAPLLLVLFVVVGLVAARAPAATYRAFIEAPRYLAWKALTYVRLARGFDPHRWDRAERGAAGDGPVVIANVRIDAVDLDHALDRLELAIDSREFTQVATVNLDFLVQAQRKPELRDILANSELNIADGMPVIWLSKLIGRPLPGRTAGSDLVPRLMARLALRSGRVFLLGGEHGVAAEAAHRFALDHPGLVVAGFFEPPRAAVDDMPNELIVQLINGSSSDVLLVAFGNPKQEQWIARHRHLLQVPVAIGVGCTLDLMTGRVRRAPTWMQHTGLEWFWRLGQEPRRLFGRYFIDGIWLAQTAVRLMAGGSSPSPV